MMSPHLIYILLIFISISYTISNNLGSKCKTCKVRCFQCESKELIPKCICDEEEFGNQTTRTCSKCDDCYSYWNSIINQSKDDIQPILMTILAKYNIDLDALANDLTNLLSQVDQAENNTSNLNIFMENFNLKSLIDRFASLTEALEEMKTKFDNVDKSQNNLEAIMKSIRDSKAMFDKLINIIKDFDDDCYSFHTPKKLMELASKFQNILDSLSNLMTLSVRTNNSSLGLAYSLESDIGMIESLFTKEIAMGSNCSTDFNSNINLIVDDIDELLGNIIDIVSGMFKEQNFEEKIEELLQKALALKLAAETILNNLTNSLKLEQKFYDDLGLIENEKKHYETILKLQTDIMATNNAMASIEKSVHNFSVVLRSKQDQLTDIEKSMLIELEKYKSEQIELDEDLEAMKILQPALDKLLQEAATQKEMLEEIDSFASIDELNDEIDEMSREIQDYIGVIENFCRESRAGSKRILL